MKLKKDTKNFKFNKSWNIKKRTATTKTINGKKKRLKKKELVQKAQKPHNRSSSFSEPITKEIINFLALKHICF